MIFTSSRKRRNKFAGAAALLALCLAAGSAWAAVDAAKQVIQSTMDEVLGVLRDKELAKEQRKEKIESIAYARFDFDRMSRLVLGKNWKDLNDQQKKDFNEEFKKHLSVTYGRRLDNYSNEKIEVLGAREEKKGDVTVKTKIVGGTANGLSIDYRMRERDGNYLAIDVIVEGVSLIQNFRAQVQDIISGQGVDSLIKILRDKNAKDAQAPPAA
jgi:phospholipid transport system substrate-binding protein